MMIQKHKFVEKNIDMLRTLTVNGYTSPKLLQYYQIYKSYMSVKEGNKMLRYNIVAKENRQSIHTVRKAVADMKKYVRG